MKKIHVDLKERSYDIFTGSGVIGLLPSVIASICDKAPIVIIADKNALQKTKSVYDRTFRKVPNPKHWIGISGGESSKSLDMFGFVIKKISKEIRMSRPIIVALGGGVVGDLAGFVAATFRRGVPFIQVPTTLLAQVDSSIGGKVGIDIPEAKNLIGAFKQPRAVIMDVDFLKTLPLKEIRGASAEIIKYGIIQSGGLFLFLENHMDQVLSRDRKALEKVIFECASIKARVVEKDEFDEKAVRIILNFGHTLGHAIEAASGYAKQYSHGDSIAIGMLAASDIAFRLGMLGQKDFKRINGIIKISGLPMSAKDVPFKKIMDSYVHDKKFVRGSNRFVLPTRIGHVETVDDIPELLIKNVMRTYAE